MTNRTGIADIIERDDARYNELLVQARQRNVSGLASPRGARVTFDPKHEEAYELALSGTVRRAA